MKWLRKIFSRKQKPQAGLTFTSTFGKKVEVGAVVCYVCKNYFFIARADFEKPTFCPYCGLNFGAALETVPGEALEEHIV